MDAKNNKVEAYLSRLEKENFNQQLNAAYGISKEQANPKIAKIGFDGKENRLGWTLANLNWILENYQVVESLLQDAREICESFKYAVFCGMGGSGLTVQLVKDTFGEGKVKIYSLRTTDPKAIKDILEEITGIEGSLEKALEKTLVIAVSKSGITIETVSHKKYFEELYKKSGIDIKKHLWVVTDKGSPMDTGDYQQKEIQLNGKGDIGGRFTAPATNIFLLPLAIAAGEKVRIILDTAKAMNDAGDIQQDIFLKLGAYLYYMASDEGKDKLIMLMPDELKDIPMWAEQLIEESLGKDGKGLSLFYAEKLSPRELKPVSQNDRVFFRINIGGRKTSPELWNYLAVNKYPVFEIDLKDIYSIGGIMLGLQRAVAAVGYLWDICFVDQPAVEGYKKATKEVMQTPGEVKVPAQWRFAAFKGLKLYYSPLLESGVFSDSQLREEIKKMIINPPLTKGRWGGVRNPDGPAEIYAAIISLLIQKTKLEAIELTSYGKMPPAFKNILEEARYNLFTQGLKLPAKLGEGPDKNHSYHQNIEAGKDMWFSTYFLADKIEQPKALEFDPNLLKAQAIGTVQSLINNKRKVVLITFDGTAQDAQGELKEFWDKVLGILIAAKIIKSPEASQMVTYDEFRKLEIKVARIQEVSPHPNADRLYVLKIDLGDSQRQIVAGIRASYKPEELVGKQIAVIVNLEPAVIRGVESQGMLLAASDDAGIAILTPQREVKPGSVVK